MDFSIRKSFKSHSSYKHPRSSGGGNRSSHEELPILSDHDLEHPTSPVDKSVDPGSVMVDIDGAATGPSCSPREAAPDPNYNHPKIQRQKSYGFWNDKEETAVGDHGNCGSDIYDSSSRGQLGPEDPPSKLIGQFLNKQRDTSEIALDMDLEMEELKHDDSRDSREMRVSFEPPVLSSGQPGNESMRRRFKDCPQEDQAYHMNILEHEIQQEGKNDRREEVLRCTSNASFERNASFQRRSGLLSRMKTKSRLIDPPQQEVEIGRSGFIGKSGVLKSGMLGRGMDDEEDDPLADADLPEKYRNAKFSALTLLQWVSLILIIAALICSLMIHSVKEITIRELKLWKWLVLFLVLICGRLVSGWGIRLIVFFIELNFLLRKRILYFVYGVRKPVQNCLWLGLVLLAWHFLFDKKVERETKSEFLKYVTKLLICFLVGTLLWLVKTLIVKVLASSFHVSTYFDRIQDSLFNQYVIETLSGPPLTEIQRREDDEARTAAEIRKLQNAGAAVPPDLRAAAFPLPRSERIIGTGGTLQKSTTMLKSGKLTRTGSTNNKKAADTAITIDHLHKLNHKNISAWNMKRLMNMVRHGSLTTLDEQILSGNATEDDSAKQIRSECEAKAAARKIFQNVARPGARYIYLEDLMRFMREDEALKTMSLFEGAYETRRINKRSLKEWVVNTFRERRALALTLNDTKTAVNKLHQMVNAIAATIIAVIWLLILGIATTKFLVFVSSQLLLVAFIFGNTCKTIFESIIFLFIIHPFDVGDRCEIDGVQMLVEEMNILTTVFLRYDNLKITFPNSVLSSKPISNFYRSPDMGDAIDFCIHIATPAEKIAIMKQRIVSYIESKKEFWCASPTVILKDVEDFTRLKMAVWLCHKVNHQNMGERWERRALLVEEMVKIFKELDIQYRLLPLDINLRSMPPLGTSNRLPSTWTDQTPNQPGNN